MQRFIFILAFVCTMSLRGCTQAPYAKGDVVKEVPLKKILNHTAVSSTLRDMSNTITILDFFGTWCVPCLKAIPHLTELKQNFKNDVAILLVSTETEAQLAKFLAKRNDFPFPVVVDEGSVLTDLFQPSALPYTVVLDKTGTVIAISEAGALTQEAVQQWLAQPVAAIKSETKVEAPAKSPIKNAMQKSENTLVQLSQNFIYNAKTGEATTTLLQQLKGLSLAQLQQSLSTDAERKAFWINLYNGFTQQLLREAPEQYKNRNEFFTKKQLQIAGIKMSLDDVEHGILRHSKIKWSLGYLNKPMPPKWEQLLRVDTVDYRIHFALNCGAKSCPPIAFFRPEALDTQLDVAAKAYLGSESKYDASRKLIRLPAILSWFRGDFGGKQGIKRVLKKYNIIPTDADPKIEFKEYDWTLNLNNYINEIQ